MSKKPFMQTKACSASKMPLDGAISVLSSLCNRKSRILSQINTFILGSSSQPYFLTAARFSSHNIPDIKLFVVIITVVLSSLTFFFF